MAKKLGGRKNFGWGRSLSFAVRNAINDRYGSGRYSTRFTTRRRLARFIAYLLKLGIRDFRHVTQDVVVEYGQCLIADVQSGRLHVATAVNYLASVNVLLSHMRGDKSVWISPKEAIGRRDQIRKVIPAGMDASAIDAAAYRLDSVGEIRLAAMIRICRLLGLRHKEAALLPIAEAYRQAKMKGCVEITRGTKGGRNRTVRTDSTTLASLGELAVKFPQGNVVPSSWSYIQWSRYCYRTLRNYATDLSLDFTCRDLRAASACSIYERETDRQAPVVTGGRCVDRETDRNARLQIAEFLGHSRTQAAGPYVGTTRRPKE